MPAPVLPRPFLRFATPPSPPGGDLPRMDVAGLAGVASAGPIGIPVAVEDPSSFVEIFGPPVGIAGAPGGGGQLHAAVRAFFAAGGRRAWIVRAGDGATRSTRFPLAGVVAVDDDGDIASA